MGCCLSGFPALKNHGSSLELVLYREVLWSHVRIMSFLKKFVYSFCEFLSCMCVHACGSQRLVFGVFFNLHFETGLRLSEARTHWSARLVGHILSSISFLYPHLHLSLSTTLALQTLHTIPAGMWVLEIQTLVLILACTAESNPQLPFHWILVSDFSIHFHGWNHYQWLSTAEFKISWLQIPEIAEFF